LEDKWFQNSKDIMIVDMTTINAVQKIKTRRIFDFLAIALTYSN